ncbi:SRPBCC domain-containing protein [Acidisphaera sp. S103]|uniref:SRPBCC family protein n=1 Tax=Acidisphaera sp. S103 TaxID=1747223 RepID=UPI00131BF051|nr:SRPBCC domain-containing protein [Acidisphaera sp. S103]
MDPTDLADDQTLILTRVFKAPRPLVFEAWTNPQRAGVWWGPAGFAIVSCEMDVRPGGAYHLRMRASDGTTHIKRGVYQAIVPPERLVFTWAWDDPDGPPGRETLVTVQFEDLGNETKLTLRQAPFESTASRDGNRGGWSGCFDRFAAYLAET